MATPTQPPPPWHRPFFSTGPNRRSTSAIQGIQLISPDLHCHEPWVAGTCKKLGFSTRGQDTYFHDPAEQPRINLFSVAFCSPAKSLTFSGLVENPISWQKVKVLTAKQSAPKCLHCSVNRFALPCSGRLGSLGLKSSALSTPHWERRKNNQKRRDTQRSTKMHRKQGQ